jgi:ABC-type transport system substrate-binding protein
MFFCDRSYDADEAGGSMQYEPDRRAKFYRDAGKRLIAELPIIPLGFERRTYVLSRTLGGFGPNPLGRDYWDAWEFSNV